MGRKFYADCAMNKKILVVDDESDVVNLIAANLKAAGFTVAKAADGAEAIEQVDEVHPALVILDLMLPKMSGLEVCKKLKGDSSTANIPVLILTAKAEEVDRIVGLELGADDYLTKPFSPRELVLRVRSILRRVGGTTPASDTIRLHDVTIDRARHTVHVKDQPVDFTATEFKLLVILFERKGRVQSRERLLSDVWGYEAMIDTRTVDTHVRRLREKLGEAGDCIETVRGFGYRVREH